MCIRDRFKAITNIINCLIGFSKLSPIQFKNLCESEIFIQISNNNKNENKKFITCRPKLPIILKRKDEIIMNPNK